MTIQPAHLSDLLLLARAEKSRPPGLHTPMSYVPEVQALFRLEEAGYRDEQIVEPDHTALTEAAAAFAEIPRMRVGAEAAGGSWSV